MMEFEVMALDFYLKLGRGQLIVAHQSSRGSFQLHDYLRFFNDMNNNYLLQLHFSQSHEPPIDTDKVP